jgi:hypothetical protein
MARGSSRVLISLLCAIVFSGILFAQETNIITVRMVDGKSGKLIATSDFLVRVDHQEEVHANWAVQSDDGTGKLTLPAEATQLSIRATYNNTTMYYVNCDANKDRGSSKQAPAMDRWYNIAEILKTGVIAPNDCIGKKIPARLQIYVKPGEFVFFVRRSAPWENLSD